MSGKWGKGRGVRSKGGMWGDDRRGNQGVKGWGSCAMFVQLKYNGFFLGWCGCRRLVWR